MAGLAKVRASGPLASHVEGFRAELVRLGYSPRTARDHSQVLAYLSRWLAAEHLGPWQLGGPVLDRFVQARRREGYRRWRSRRSLRPVLGYLRQVGAVPAESPIPAGPLESLLEGYRRYLLLERRIAPCTVHAYLQVARRFLSPRVAGDRLDLDDLAAFDVGLQVVVGAHRLRHTAATAMLRRGASLPQVAEVLRHRSEDTTAIYAKVDRAALDLVVRPWPGGGR